MPLLSFQARFAPAVANGVAELRGEPLPHPGLRPKRQTIRAFRKDHRDPKVGDTLYLWTRLRHRTLPAIKLSQVTCTSTCGLEVKQVGRRLGLALPDVVKVTPWPIASPVPHLLVERPLDALAKADGFETWPELLAFIEKTHGLPFYGLIICW
jgi:hypothetical protein